MRDRPKPDHHCLFEAASEHGGYFTSAQARQCGFNRAILSHHVVGGRYIRVRRGLYRLKEYPSSPHEDVIQAWLALGKEKAVISHNSALDLLGLSDMVPDRVHVTIARHQRGRRKPAGVRIHTAVRPPARTDVTNVEGIPVTAPARTIVDVTAAGASPEHVFAATRAAISRGIVTRGQLERAAREHGGYVERVIREALDTVTPR